MQASDRPGKIGEFMNTTQIYEQHSYQNIYKYSWDSHQSWNDKLSFSENISGMFLKNIYYILFSNKNWKTIIYAVKANTPTSNNSRKF